MRTITFLVDGGSNVVLIKDAEAVNLSIVTSIQSGSIKGVGAANSMVTRAKLTTHLRFTTTDSGAYDVLMT